MDCSQAIKHLRFVEQEIQSGWILRQLLTKLFLPINWSNSLDYNLHKYRRVSCNSSVNIGGLINHLRPADWEKEDGETENCSFGFESRGNWICSVFRSIMMTSDMIGGLQFCTVINFTRFPFKKLSAFYIQKEKA